MENLLFKTKDLQISAYLALDGFELVKVEKTNGITFFFFNNAVSAEKKANLFSSGKVEGNLKEYANSLKNVKRKLFEEGKKI